MSKIILSDGTELASDFCYPMSREQLTLTVYGQTMHDLVQILSADPARVQKITFCAANGALAQYDGFIRLVSVMWELDHIRVILEQEVP